MHLIGTSEVSNYPKTTFLCYLPLKLESFIHNETFKRSAMEHFRLLNVALLNREKEPEFLMAKRTSNHSFKDCQC